MKPIYFILFTLLFAFSVFAGQPVNMGTAGAAVTLQNHYQGLIASYSLDTTAMKSGTMIADGSGYRNDGTITAGASTWFENDFRGVANSALDFDGANTKIDCGSDWIGTQAITISAWIYADSWGESNNGRIIDNGKTQVHLRSDYGIIIYRDGGVTGGAVPAMGSITLGNWYYVVITSTNLSICNWYINGVLSGTVNQNIGDPIAGTTNVIIGNDASQNRTHDGRIACVNIYNEVKSATWAKEGYKLYKPAFIMDN